MDKSMDKSIVSPFFDSRCRSLSGFTVSRKSEARGANLESKGRGHLERKCNRFFAHIFVKSGSIYVKPRPKWSPAHSTHVEYTPPLHRLFTFPHCKRKWTISICPFCLSAACIVTLLEKQCEKCIFIGIFLLRGRAERGGWVITDQQHYRNWWMAPLYLSQLVPISIARQVVAVCGRRSRCSCTSLRTVCQVKCFVLCYLSAIIREDRMLYRPLGRAPTYSDKNSRLNSRVFSVWHCCWEYHCLTL